MTRILFYVIFIFIFCIDLLSQNQIAFNRLSVENGLSHSSVTCIFQDKHGFIWFGTQDGLNRYDGYRFKVFRNNPEDSTSLTESFIFSIYEDVSGNLYIQTISKTFHKYNPHDESFKVIDEKDIQFQGTRYSTVGAFLREKSGVTWDGGLGAATGLIYKNSKTGETRIYKNNPSDPESISDDRVYSIFRDREGRLWIGTKRGLDLLDENSGKFYHYRNDPRDPDSIPSDWVWPVFQDSDGHLWIGTVETGLCRFDPESGKFANFRNDPANQRSLSDNFTFSIFEDRSGVMWVGTNAGLNYFNSSAQAFEYYGHNPDDKNSLSEENILSAFVDKNGTYWIGTRNGGFDRFDYKKKKVKNYPVYGVQAIHQDKKGNLLLGTFSDGLVIFNPATENFKTYTHDPSNKNSISDNRIYAICEDRDENFWIGTDKGGLNRFDPHNSTFEKFQYDSTNPSSISSNNIWSVMADDSGNIWAGTFGGGLNVFDKKKKEFKHFIHDPADPSSISDDIIFRIFSDSKGNIWVGTRKGLNKFISTDNSFKTFNEDDGLANNHVYAIIEDKYGFLWLSTNYGISKFDPIRETFRNYYAQDGLQGNEFNQFAYGKDITTGNIIFGGTKGLSVFNPANIRENTFSPPVVFTEFLRFNTDDEEGKPIVEKGVPELDSIILTYKDNIITLNFAALSYYNSFDNKYRYILEGFNENWIQLGTENSVTFTNLSPGEYTLRVVGSNNDGVWNNKGAALFIEVLPPWWRTKIAYAIYGFLFLSMLYGARRFEMNRHRQKAYLRETELKIKATEAEKRAIEIENERKTKELEEARQLQLSMLPKTLPQLDNMDIAAFMRTATEVGGDYYDFICQQNGVLNIAFGDATGHGLQAGTMVTLMKGFFTSDAARLSLPEFMNHCSNLIKEIKLGRILMSFSFLRVEDNRLYITSGGMPPVYFYNSETGETEEILIQGMPLGAMRKFGYKTIEREIKKGDTILLLSDGLPEQMNKNDEMFNYHRVKDTFHNLAEKHPETIIEQLVKSGDEWMDGIAQADDISFVVLKVK